MLTRKHAGLQKNRTCLGPPLSKPSMHYGRMKKHYHEIDPRPREKSSAFFGEARVMRPLKAGQGVSQVAISLSRKFEVFQVEVVKRDRMVVIPS